MVRWIWFLTGCGGVLTPETEVAADEPANPPPYTTNGEPGPEFQDVYGERVTLTGRYLVEQGAGDFRAPQVATLQADDGRTFITSYSADPKYYPLVDLKVVVTGRPYEPSMMKRSMYGHHFEIESMGLAAGETPRSGARNRPVADVALAATSSGVPVAITRPPPAPPSGPRSIR